MEDSPRLPPPLKRGIERSCASASCLVVTKGWCVTTLSPGIVRSPNGTVVIRQSSASVASSCTRATVHRTKPSILFDIEPVVSKTKQMSTAEDVPRGSACCPNERRLPELRRRTGAGEPVPRAGVAAEPGLRASDMRDLPLRVVVGTDCHAAGQHSRGRLGPVNPPYGKRYSFY